MIFLSDDKVAMDKFLKKVFEYINPAVNPDIEPAFTEWQEHIPTLWLLGKTGAGKSTLIQVLTGDSQVEIGNGFQPCTRTAARYLYPNKNPVVSFLDTRGLSEAEYDPAEDIAVCEQRSHALMVVMKAEEPEQSELLRALKVIRKSKKIKHLLVIHTAVKSILNVEERERAILYNHDRVLEVWQKKNSDIPPIRVDFIPEINQFHGIEQLHEALTGTLPMLSLLSNKQAHVSREEQNFERLKKEVLWYSGSAGASDAIPAVGLVTVPAIQSKMLHSLANQYGTVWNKKDYAEFIGTLGSGFLVQYLSRLGVRQLIKFIPAYGQTVGSATAAMMSFSYTYAIGRAACKYLYHKNKGEVVSKEEMEQTFEQAFKSVKPVAERQHSSNHQKRDDL